MAEDSADPKAESLVHCASETKGHLKQCQRPKKKSHHRGKGWEICCIYMIQNYSYYKLAIHRLAWIKFNNKTQWKRNTLLSIYHIVFVLLVQLLSCVWLFMTPWTFARHASLSFTVSWSLLKLISIELVIPSNHLILCHPLLLPPPIPPSIRVFSNVSTL